MTEMDGKYFLGKIWDPKTGQLTDDALRYDSEDLTTHAVVVGMTGSGKTGLCVGLLEEAALNRVPALMIDPKGDLTNLLLHFPDLLPADFQPWINAAAAKKEGKTEEQAAAETAEMWRKGLADWGIGPERLQNLADSVNFTIYTPGSTAGVPLSVLASLGAPALPWAGNEEVLGEQISGTVTALLSLTGMKDIDPVQSREHILLSNILADAWRNGRNLDLGELIMQIQTPPFAKLGVLDVNSFFPEKDRFGLAMRINSMLASPSFQTWMEGEPLDVQALLYTPDGQPRHSIFYIAHLSEEERMFFVTLLYANIETWMRAQSGTTSLRAIVYFDEIFGYMPPLGNPPSKTVMLRMLKQARAFGVGMVLATQNPVDVDYKGLSNAGTWFIGKLGTEQDKARLLDGLTSAIAGAVDVKELDRLISGIGKRVFLMRNVNEKKPLLFQTRWAMNYLAGPLTRTQIPALNALTGASQAAAAAPSPVRPAAPGTPEATGTMTRPPVPGGAGEYFLPANLTLSEAAETHRYPLAPGARESGILYRPALLAQAGVHLTNAKYALNTDTIWTALIYEAELTPPIRWEDNHNPPVDDRKLDRAPVSDARFASLGGPLADAKLLRALETDFIDYIVRNGAVTIRANDKLKVYGGPEMSDADFAQLCEDAADDLMQAELDKVKARFETKLKSVEEKLKKEERELAEDEAEFKSRKGEEYAKHAETLLSFFGGRRKSLSSSLSKRRMAEKAKADIEESEQAIADMQEQLGDLKGEMEVALDEVEAKYDALIADTKEVPVAPKKTDVRVAMFGVAWVPHYLVESGGRTLEVPAYTAE
ncbi:MAG: ATP-binding protein [Anaerolineae bacterium]|uniref:helicase HerA domain-containing protein n=1 Tax=Promineifilum sp. TaxID=2664178 RepID=UPI001DE2B2AB|nr:ATP-binding protein [Anaerolineales bacterium]MCB8936053.1 ATP-binding protein [Promineifilum sp.]MCO5181360.1 DUF87 domain-containing protein [Promineifilum sp.]MCW5848147.1 ATP-binding protein [Anaerolineae bacterium]